MSKTHYVQRIINKAKSSPTFIVVSVVLVLISSVLTITSFIVLMRSVYSNTSFYDKKVLLEKIEKLTPEANIEYFKETIGNPVFINEGEGGYKEYVFVNKYSIITAVTENGGKVLVYSVTTRKKDFNPSIILGPYYEDTKPVKITLGRSTFSDIDKARISDPKIMTGFGAHVYYYDEEYYGGNPTNYQSIIFSINQAGLDDEDWFLSDRDRELSLEDTDLKEYRKRKIINTYSVTSPMVNAEDLGIEGFGPTYDQIRIMPNFFNE